MIFCYSHVPKYAFKTNDFLIKCSFKADEKKILIKTKFETLAGKVAVINHVNSYMLK